MVNLLWFLLNIAAVFGLFLLFLDWLGFVKSRFGWFVAILVGVISIGAITKGQEKVSEQETVTISPCASDINAENDAQGSFERIALESNLIQTIYFDYFFCNSHNEKLTSTLIPGQVNLSGLVLGFDWETMHIVKIKGQEDERIAYKINGMLHWKILGLQFFSQSKEYEVVLD